MGLLSTMSEDEIKKRQIEQDARQRDLERREADLEGRKAEVAADEKRVTDERTTLAGERAKAKKEIFDAEQLLAVREAEAKNGFLVQQREAFRDAIELRSLEVDAGLRELAELKTRLGESLAAHAVDKAVLAARELAVKEREQQADVDFPEATQKVLAAVASREASCAERARVLEQRDAEAREQHKALESRTEALRKREEQVALAEATRDAGYAESRRALDVELRARRQELADRAEELCQRADLVARAEEERDRGFTEIRRAVDVELHERRHSVEEALGQLRLERLSDLQREIAGERQRRRAELQHELDAERTTANAQIDGRRISFAAEQAQAESALRAAHEQANQRQASLTATERELDYRKRALDEWEVRLDARKQALDAEVAQLVAHRKRALDAAEADLATRVEMEEVAIEEAIVERKKSFETKEESLKTEMNRLRMQIHSSERLLGNFEGLKRQLGGRDAEQVIAEMSAQESALRDLREKLAERTPAMRDEFERLRGEREALQARLDAGTTELADLQARMRGENALRRELMEAQDQEKSLATKVEVLEGSCRTLEEENRRLRSAYARESDRDARIADIENADPTDKRDIPRRSPELPVDENEWLDGINQACIDYGLRFHPRILKAFHTALKTAEWSPLTVLAGVSGTGKSELPKLYAHFGGLTFKSLAVQPNWDSQESMLGFFNSIDNKFDAQPVLRLLARSQQPWSENYGLQDHLVMLLLDEMNLAHAELYFAEFLSKLELRRGRKGSDIPDLEVKLGAGLLPYKVPMGRNVLWTGTMNQDETTKSLSDKVLDRSIVIHFPRPASLERRRELKQLPAAAPLLPRKVWEKWWTRKSDFTDDQIHPFKTVIEGINGAMSRVGRALGHRVWQSVEYYLANYPDTLTAQRSGDKKELERAMRTAFEDQLVQKVMPKLRGIETRGHGKTLCLDKVRDILTENGYDSILDDFNLSCEFGYGQFIWQTVSFLQEPAVPERPPTEVTTVTTEPPAEALSTGAAAAAGPAAENIPAADPADDDLPTTFMPDDEDRAKKWKRLSPAKRKKHMEGEGGKGN